MTTPWIPRLQDCVRSIARRENDVISAPPLSAYLHPSDPLPAFSYAIPDCPMLRPVGGDLRTGVDLDAALARIYDVFVERDRWPRFEFLQQYAPVLAVALEAAGYAQESSEPVLYATAESLRHAHKVPGLVLTRLGSDAPIPLVQEMLTVQRRGFEGDDAPGISVAAARRFLEKGAGSRGRLARLDGAFVGAGTLSAPCAGLCELRGIATLASYRRRGIASALTAGLARDAFRLGAEAVFLSAENDDAARLYQRLGFRRVATMVAYVRTEGMT